MAYNQAAKVYGNNRVNTASQAELTLMLYEGAVKFGNIAITALEKKDYETTNTNIQKCRNIIVELTSTLNMKYAVAEDFKKMYDYIFALLIHANLEKDMEMLDRAVSEIRDMRDIWKQIMGKTKGPQLTLDMK
ncbi:MAG: flagellar export chaperone FliS [Lachnospiraceae bacterium]|nr:flagellar export chaperone FliS [Lachnospiraceae bacterium]